MSRSAKQDRFVEEYLVDLNATQAAIRAGYSPKTAGIQGHDILKRPKVAEAIAKAFKKRSERTEITQDRVLKELARIGFSDLRRVMTTGGNLKDPLLWDDDVAPAISSIEVVTKPGPPNKDGEREVEHVAKIKTWDKVAALEKIGRHLGMFPTRVEHTGRNGGPVSVQSDYSPEFLSRLSKATLEDMRQAALSGTKDDG
jgi:phage terminase small subunit